MLLLHFVNTILPRSKFSLQDSLDSFELIATLNQRLFGLDSPRQSVRALSCDVLILCPKLGGEFVSLETTARKYGTGEPIEVTYVMYRLSESSQVMNVILHQLAVPSDKIGDFPWLAHFELSAHRQERNNMHIVTSDLANVNVPS